MKIALDWLQEFVECSDVESLIDGLTRSGVEVEAVDDPSAKVHGVVVARVVSAEKHPKADKLKICRIDDGDGEKQVICGASNVAEGQWVAYAREGSHLGPIEINARKLRGVMSHGMICSRSELGLDGDSAGIWELPGNPCVGEAIFDAFPAAVVLELGITPNRPDLLSHVGIAREAAAVFGTKLARPMRRPLEKGAPVDGQARVVVEDTVGCRRYMARVLCGVEVTESPEWLRQRLERIGQRSVNNVVDATNYVLFELGHPLHAFDLARLRSEGGPARIEVRRARNGERLRTLDDVERELSTEDLVIADAHQPVALAGVMGGMDSEVRAGTTSILLESAWFDPSRVRYTAKRFGLHTEASHRFERGADPGALGRALDRCAQLIVEVAGGESAQGVIDVTAKTETVPDIRLRLNRLQGMLGVPFTGETVIELLEPLEIRCTLMRESDLLFAPPSFRPDLRDEIDLVEEVARRYGYDAIPETLPGRSGALQGFEAPQRLPEVVARTLRESGFTEAVTYGFASPRRYADFAPSQGEPLRIKNPLGEELSAIRTTLIPGLLEGLSRNSRHGARSVRLFEIGATFHRRQVESIELSPRDALLPREQRRAAFVLWGLRYPGGWFASRAEIDFSDLAGVLDQLADALGLARRMSRFASERPWTNPVASAELRCDDEVVGWAGQLHPEVLAAYDVKGLVFAAELSLSRLADHPPDVIQVQPLPRFPRIRRDLAVMVPVEQSSRELADYLREHAGGDLGPDAIDDIELFDVYRGEGIPDDRVSLAYTISYRHRDRTLTDDEVNQAFRGVVAAVNQRFDAEIR